MRLSDIESNGGYVDPTPVKKTITWKMRGGKEYTGDVFVVRQSFGAVQGLVGNAEQDRVQAAQLIQLYIRLGDDASERLTYEQAYSLDPALAWAFVGAINEVNAPKA